jgi:SAM-dependent methyltransferase
MDGAAKLGQSHRMRFVKANGPHVYCLTHGRRRLVPYAEWWRDEGFAPAIESLAESVLLAIPLGPLCPIYAGIRDKSVAELVDDPDAVRLQLGLLLRGEGIECGAGDRPFPIPLDVSVRYVDPFDYGGEQARSFPGERAEFMPVDAVDRIEALENVPDAALDFVIASHVIEHSPNPLAALVAFHRVLRRCGKVILIVPDRDRTFDQNRWVTTVDHLLLDYLDYRRERDLAHYCEFQERVLDGTVEKAHEEWQIGADLHYHTFTPQSWMAFLGVAQEYAAWSGVECWFPKTTAEFYCVLSR